MAEHQSIRASDQTSFVWCQLRGVRLQPSHLPRLFVLALVLNPYLPIPLSPYRTITVWTADDFVPRLRRQQSPTFSNPHLFKPPSFAHPAKRWLEAYGRDPKGGSPSPPIWDILLVHSYSIGNSTIVLLVQCTRSRASLNTTNCTYKKVNSSAWDRWNYSDHLCMPVSGREERAGLPKLVCNLLGLILCESGTQRTKRPRVMAPLARKFVDDRSN